MLPPATALCVDDAAKVQLESLVRSGTTPQRVAQKCRVILLAQEGMSNHSIAKQLGLSRPTVIAARATFGTGGVQALTAKPTRNRSRRPLTPEVEKKILDTTLKTRPPDATPWTVRTLAKHLRVSRMMVHRVWQRFDIQPHRVEKFKLSNDPQFEEKVRDIAGLYLDPPERALVLCVDEKSQIQALDRTAPILPLRPGLPETSDPRLQTLRNDHSICRLQYLERQSHRQLLAASSRQRVCEVSQPSGEASSSRPGRAHHFGQLQHAQECHGKAVAQIQKAPPLLFPLHPHQQFLAQSGGTLLRLDHRTYDPPRHLPQVWKNWNAPSMRGWPIGITSHA